MTGTEGQQDSSDGWGSATHYAGDRLIEPRTFTESDPMTAGLLLDERAGDDGGSSIVGLDEHRWGATTYVGRGRRHRRAAPGTAAATGHRAAHAAPPETGPPETAAAETAAAESAAIEADAGIATATGTVRERGLLANSRSMALASLASRLTGFVRSVLLVAALGVGAVGNAYNSGNNLPNMIYELLLGGVLSSVLIPLLVKAEAEDEDGGLAYTQRLLSIAVAALAAMTLLVTAAAPWIAAVFVPAGPKRELTSIFATLLLPEIFFYGLGAMVMAVLNIKHVYGPGAWSPLLNNLVLIITIGVFWTLPGPDTLDPTTMTTAQILVVGIGTTLGIAAQALVLLPYLRRTGFTWQWRFRSRPGEQDRLRELGSLAGWVLAYVVISQLGVSVIQKVGNDNGGFSAFTNADLLFQMPYGILVVSLLTAIMPRMSRAAVRHDISALIADLSLAARLSAVALLPVTALLLVLGPALGVTLFAHGETSFAGARLIGSALAWSAFGLFPFALVMLQLRVFYAMRDGRTPTYINLGMVGAKVALILITNSVYSSPNGVDVNDHPSTSAVEWLNIATSLSYVVGAVAGHVLLTRRLGPLGVPQAVRTIGQIAIASVLGAAAAYGVARGAVAVLGDGRGGAAASLTIGGVVGLAAIVLVAWRMRLPELRAALGRAAT